MREGVVIDRLVLKVSGVLPEDAAVFARLVAEGIADEAPWRTGRAMERMDVKVLPPGAPINKESLASAIVAALLAELERTAT